MHPRHVPLPGVPRFGHLGESRLQRGLRSPLRRLLRCGAPRRRLRRGARRALRAQGPKAAAERGEALGFSRWETWMDFVTDFFEFGMSLGVK